MLVVGFLDNKETGVEIETLRKSLDRAASLRRFKLCASPALASIELVSISLCVVLVFKRFNGELRAADPAYQAEPGQTERDARRVAQHRG